MAGGCEPFGRGLGWWMRLLIVALLLLRLLLLLLLLFQAHEIKPVKTDASPVVTVIMAVVQG